MTTLMERTIAAVSLATVCFDTENIQKTTQKGSNPANYVTNVDKEIERKLNKELAKIIPDAKFVGEESDANDYNAEYVWIVDPIDGTANFKHGVPNAYTSVGLVKDGIPWLGVIYNPATGDMWTAENGDGAYLNGEPIHVSNNSLAHSLFNVHWDVYNRDKSNIAFEVARRAYGQIEDVRTFGSAAYSLASIACGQTDIMYCQNCFSWDIAAGLCILREAGGYYKLIDAKDDDWRTGKTTVVAANNQIAITLIESIYNDVVHHSDA